MIQGTHRRFSLITEADSKRADANETILASALAPSRVDPLALCLLWSCRRFCDSDHALTAPLSRRCLSAEMSGAARRMLRGRSRTLDLAGTTLTAALLLAEDRQSWHPRRHVRAYFAARRGLVRTVDWMRSGRRVALAPSPCRHPNDANGSPAHRYGSNTPSSLDCRLPAADKLTREHVSGAGGVAKVPTRLHTELKAPAVLDSRDAISSGSQVDGVDIYVRRSSAGCRQSLLMRWRGPCGTAYVDRSFTKRRSPSLTRTLTYRRHAVR